MRPNPLYILIAISLLIFSCKEDEVAELITRDEALSMAKKIDSAVVNDFYDYWMSLINDQAFTDRVGKVLERPATKKDMQHIRQSLVNANYTGYINASLKKGGSYELLRHYEKDKVHHLLYRSYGPDGLNYNDYELIKVDGKVYIADIFLYMSGRSMSQSLTESAMHITTELAYKGITQRDIDALNEVEKLKDEGRYADAKIAFDDLPDGMKNLKTAQILNVGICAGLDEETYSKALKEFELRYRHQPFVFISQLDAQMLRNDYNGALNSVNKIDSLVGTDPILDFLRYHIYKQIKDGEKALQAIENLNKNMPHFSDGVIELIATYLEDGEYEKARPLVESYRSNKKFNQDILEEHLELYPGFEAQH